MSHVQKEGTRDSARDSARPRHATRLHGKAKELYMYALVRKAAWERVPSIKYIMFS